MKKLYLLLIAFSTALYAGANSFVDNMLVKALQDDNSSDVKYWLEHGANANCNADDGLPVLKLAMVKDFDRHHSFQNFDNSVVLTELLLQHGADPNSDVSILPLTSAINKLGDYRLCNVLLKYGANPRLVEPYVEVRKNAIDFAKSLGYTRVAQLLANPKSYSERYTVFELNYLIKISFNQQKFDETIKYCKQFYDQLPQELSSNYDGWLTKAHILFYHESALFQKSLIAAQEGDLASSENLLLEAIKYEEERKRAGDMADLGVDLNERLRNVRNWRQDNPAAVLDDLDFLLKQGRKDTTVIYYLYEASKYLGSINDLEGQYNCLSMAYKWIKEDQTLRKQLSKNLYYALLLHCTSNYYPDAAPIMTEEDLHTATSYIQKEYGAQSMDALWYESAKVAYYIYTRNIDKAIEQSKTLAAKLEPLISSNNINSGYKENIQDLYVLTLLRLSDLYASKYPYSAYQYVSIYDENKDHSPTAEQLLSYKTIKKIFDNPLINKNLHVVCYKSMIGTCYDLALYDEMWKYVPQYYQLNRQFVDNTLTTMAEDEAIYWWGYGKPFMFEDYVILATNRCSIPSNIPGHIYNNELFKKDLLLRTNKRLQQYITESAAPTIVHLYNQVISQKTELMQLQSQKQIDDSQTNALKESIASNERLLASVSNVYAHRKKEMNISWQDIQTKLRPNEVAIEFINTGMVDQYWALIVRKEYQQPKFVYLKDFKRFYPDDIQSQMDSWKQYGEPYGIKEPEFLQFSGDAGEVYKYGTTENGTKLYNALWKPLTEYIHEGDVVYFAPSGVLLQLAVEALPVDAQSVLADHYKLVRMSSTRELALQHASNPKKDAVLYGNIQYNVDDIDVFVAESERYQGRSRGIDVSIPDGVDRASVKPLPGTKAEVDGISKLLSKARYTSSVIETYNANEESFKSLSGSAPQILHIATHGFYWDNDRASNEPFVARTTPQGTTMVDPLMRCGLLFAGANVTFSGRGNTLPEGVDDGILTAKEISLMNLQNTKLLVLSACETGLGELTDAGVFGLQRAFKQAGVETIIMSLWKVNDTATQMMMSKFYEFLLSGQDKRTAFYNAQKEIRRAYPSPFYWAGFIMLD